jgi:hypothetical protein
MTPPDPIPLTTVWHPGGAFGAAMPPDGYYLVVWAVTMVGTGPVSITIRRREFDYHRRVQRSTWAHVAWWTDAKGLVESLSKLGEPPP